MTEPRYQAPPTDPRARLRELQEDATISPEIADLRLAILRREVPDSIVQIEAIRADDTAIAVKVMIALPGGGRHTAIASEDVDGDRSWSEQFEMVNAIAIAKALDGLGSRSGQEGARQQTRPAQQQRQQPAQPAISSQSDEDHLPEYSWNAFWQTMNSRNITREQVEKALGKTVQEATPKEAVDVLKAAGLL